MRNGKRVVEESDPFDELTAVVQADDYNWLLDNAPAYARAIERLVSEAGRDLNPEDVYRHIVRMTYDGREGLAVRCKNAAAHLLRQAVT